MERMKHSEDFHLFSWRPKSIEDEVRTAALASYAFLLPSGGAQNGERLFFVFSSRRCTFAYHAMEHNTQNYTLPSFQNENAKLEAERDGDYM